MTTRADLLAQYRALAHTAQQRDCPHVADFCRGQLERLKRIPDRYLTMGTVTEYRVLAQELAAQMERGA